MYRSLADARASRRAGAHTAFLVSQATQRFPDPPADVMIKSLDELKPIIPSLI